MTLNTPIQPCLWLETQAEEAARCFTSVFPNSRMGTITHYGANAPFAFNPAVLFMLPCQDQAELDHCGSALAEDPLACQCGWLSDRFGVTWQIVPQIMMDLLPTPDSPARRRFMTALTGMRKPDVAALERVYSQP